MLSSWDKKLQELTEKIIKCTACDLKNNRTNVVPGSYGPRKGLCFIGEAPGYFEDKRGLPFVGKSGKLLDNMLREIGLVRNEVTILNVVKCRPTTSEGRNRTPTEQELRFCGEKWLVKQLKLLEPKLIVTLGGIALRFFFPKMSVTKTVGQLLKTADGYELFATYHPAYVLRNFNLLEEYETHFKQIRLLMDRKENKSKNEPKERINEKKMVRQKSLVDFIDQN